MSCKFGCHRYVLRIPEDYEEDDTTYHIEDEKGLSQCDIP